MKTLIPAFLTRERTRFLTLHDESRNNPMNIKRNKQA